jgi:catechol 2,3-dioxygenase-like lactoylglutathione lyase family enzyme
MTATGSQIFAYHIGIVVRDIEDACARYQDLLGVREWHRVEMERPGLPTNPKTAGGYGYQHIAYGRLPGATFELIQPEGKSVFSVFLKERGEGIQHIGVWTPDVQAAVREAIARGCVVTHAALTDDVSSVQLTTASPPDAIVPYLAHLAYVDPGFGGFQIEYVGDVRVEWLRGLFTSESDDPITPPPWYKEPS